MDFRKLMNDFFAQTYRQDELYDIWAKQNGMKSSTVAVLYLLDQCDTCTQGWISKMCLVPKQTIHTVVQELERDGYLEKVSAPGRKEKPLRQTVRRGKAERSVPRGGTRGCGHRRRKVRRNGGNDPQVYRCFHKGDSQWSRIMHWRGSFMPRR